MNFQVNFSDLHKDKFATLIKKKQLFFFSPFTTVTTFTTVSAVTNVTTVSNAPTLTMFSSVGITYLK